MACVCVCARVSSDIWARRLARFEKWRQLDVEKTVTGSNINLVNVVEPVFLRIKLARKERSVACLSILCV